MHQQTMPECEPLEYLPMERWHELESAFEADWPRGISGLMALRTQRQLSSRGLGYGFKVYCPYGKAEYGMVAFNKKGELNEIIIQCPNHNTRKLEESLVNTKLIDWTATTLVPYMPENIRTCIQKVAAELNVVVEDEDTVPNEVYILDKRKTLFDLDNRVSDATFQPITDKYVSVLDSTWRNRYSGSKWLFQTLIRANFAFGIYKEHELLSWVLNNEVGALTHLFTLEEYRGKGYAEELMKRFCNTFKENETNLFCYCRRGNVAAGKLYEKLGFERFHEDVCNELIIQCPKDNTAKLEKALVDTRLIDWTKFILLPSLPDHVVGCIERVSSHVNTEIEPEVHHPAHHLVLRDASLPIFDDIRLPEGVEFRLITEEYIELVNSVWLNRHEGSLWMFKLLVDNETAYGLFKDKELLSCVFVNEAGMFMHMYTFEKHRNKGYAKNLLKLLCNEHIKSDKPIFCFCHKDNVEALKLYESLGFKILHLVRWCFMNPKLS